MSGADMNIGDQIVFSAVGQRRTQLYGREGGTPVSSLLPSIRLRSFEPSTKKLSHVFVFAMRCRGGCRTKNLTALAFDRLSQVHFSPPFPPTSTPCAFESRGLCFLYPSCSHIKSIRLAPLAAAALFSIRHLSACAARLLWPSLSHDLSGRTGNFKSDSCLDSSPRCCVLSPSLQTASSGSPPAMAGHLIEYKLPSVIMI
ncbi:hypothetical protein R3P38DRAFT_58728 [Favolaschia claudopus]|uniref:Uncharacterized protein n=1 Tax=Favolaschia claudopus TaxID=2862362 RepID=A0AAW0EL24_9AGAR